MPSEVLELPNVTYGGTGFFYDKAPRLSEKIEHHMPEYHLYDDWVVKQLAAGGKKCEYTYYTDYSIGFLTRGCFRKCSFCVNQNYDRVHVHSALSEFLDVSRKKICMLDDNFLGCPSWKEILVELKATGKPFQFKQGLDERLLTDEKCEALFSGKYDGDFIFAFDNVADAELIEKKMVLARKYTDRVLKFYCFTGFDRADKWDDDFWNQDIFDLFTRIEILMKHKCLPYVMRFNRYEESPWHQQGYLLATEGNVVNYDFIEKFIEELGTKYHILEIAVDRWNATMLTQHLMDDGFTMVPFGQGYKDMSPATKEFSKLLFEGKIVHGGNPVLRWMSGNVVVETDAAENIKVTKAKSPEKIDGIVAAIMALDRAVRNQSDQGSVYDERGIVIL